MIQLDNDYMKNKRGIDLQSRLKIKDNASGAVQIFLEQLSFRLYDYVLSHSTKFKDYEAVDLYIDKLSEFNKEQFKRAISEQCLFILSTGDLNYKLPDGTMNLSYWKEMRICQQAKDIIYNLHMITKTGRIGNDFDLYHRYEDLDDEFRY